MSKREKLQQMLADGLITVDEYERQSKELDAAPSGPFVEELPTEECPIDGLPPDEGELLDISDLPTEDVADFELPDPISESNSDILPEPALTITKGHATPPVDPSLQQWQGVHVASLFINIFPQLFRTVMGAWPILLVIFFTNSSSGTELIDLTLISLFFILATGRTFSHFLTLRYRIRDEKLEIKQGLFFRRTRILDPSRIQNMELVQNPLHKLFQLVELRIETAGDSSTYGLLSALRNEDAEKLRSQLLSAKDPVEEIEADAQPLAKNSIVELLLYGFTERTVGTVVVLALIGSEVFTLLNPSEAREVASLLTLKVAAGFFLVAFSGSWFWSAAKAVIKHAGFKIFLQGNQLQTQEGLLTKRRVEIYQNKVQIVEVIEPLLRRILGFGTVHIDTAALRIANGEPKQTEGIIPMAQQQDFPKLLQAAAPQIAVNPWKTKLNPPHPRALYRNAVQKLLRGTFFAFLLMWVLQPLSWSWLAVLLIVVAIPLAYLDWRWQGWLVTPDAVVSRRGYVTRYTWMIDRDKIQSAHINQTPFMRIHGLAQVVIRVANSDVALPDISLEKAKSVVQNLREQWE